MRNINIIIVGVGGQGALLASKILGRVGMKKNYDVKVSEVHGMSQRGGSVVTYVRFGEKLHSPIVEKGQADIILAFEELEALRWIEYLNEKGIVIVNTEKIYPLPVIIGKEKYPDNIIDSIKSVCKNTISLDCLKICKKYKNMKISNMVILGAFSRVMDIEKELWIQSIKETVPQRFLDINMKAFEEGRMENL
ncbi:indolepyruvate ferredoxin oxidoreductase beta subunit [Clostridium acetobutylicum]|uniref:Indolepyruvate ferredoxin oxidoreductase subunit beta n=1 Tax=Clostridium acetobutylicum (strain ATCC 824 / DSM 792 / JCM 1419 / IAM 19013 / LMG 5710 / NBRC 13948 / NRRL B-527 / VKM B-1787 / 2291 / W) TaxID=272562 RepID=Q97HL1_CLOAB|nr:MULTISPECIES: indolepyruvate oxidoreductase subunit beta [Clostridium]AAK79959.1 Indolepyruvate ferredoxin oxidoreductase, subunit beta [Clostridium acetobutylicum ATCC 824]ADZ21052.1 indolepyruvate oxidoreductase subunit B [Clostridium acetobutylicum EA 2018]AEI33300.1 indolepyruvate oxidoreductase subunit beta [Clostridium acetobutylicum DSM 1731]AWV79609.1 indolepyruvate oxidoreductase subunit beta [Clostridium acetobutylicum]MBC2394417.1 indolepyruvate oxidoreductase subunit beta [Clost